jgi:hypothetical protein
MTNSRVAAGTALAVFLLASVACNDAAPTEPSSGARTAETNDNPRMPIQRVPDRHIEPRATPTAKYDGAYDLTINGCVMSFPEVPPYFACTGNAIVLSAPGAFVVIHGNANFANIAFGPVDPTFGNLVLRGVCPRDGTATAVFTGILNAGSGNKFGQGQYVCSGGTPAPPFFPNGLFDGATGTWQVSNGR